MWFNSNIYVLDKPNLNYEEGTDITLIGNVLIRDPFQEVAPLWDLRFDSTFILSSVSPRSFLVWTVNLTFELGQRQFFQDSTSMGVNYLSQKRKGGEREQEMVGDYVISNSVDCKSLEIWLSTLVHRSEKWKHSNIIRSGKQFHHCPFV